VTLITPAATGEMIAPKPFVGRLQMRDRIGRTRNRNPTHAQNQRRCVRISAAATFGACPAALARRSDRSADYARTFLPICAPP